MKYCSSILVLLISLASLNFSVSSTQATIQREQITQMTNNYGSIKVIRDKIILDFSLQQELQKKIIIARNELEHLSQTLGINSSDVIGLGYLHQGQNFWKIQFTFGGIILDTSEIILSTEQVFALKKLFKNTDSLLINGKKYKTTRSMIQLGLILHERQELGS